MPTCFRTALAGRVVRRPEVPGVRVRIYGSLEARLQSADRVVLGGLVEGIWPPETRSDPWLSRPMRDALGLDLPERRISLAAHDFAQALGAREVILTSAAKLAGAPTVPSRFVQRLAAVAGARWERCARPRRTISRLGAQHRPSRRRSSACAQPAPKPPRDARPTALSVTEIEHWLRDPYTIYRQAHPQAARARSGRPAAGRRRSRHRHPWRDRRVHAKAMRARCRTTRSRRARRDRDASISLRSMIIPRRARSGGRAICGSRAGSRTGSASGAAVSLRSTPRTRARSQFRSASAPSRLSTRADRIERLADGSYAILDYKTGTVPTEKQVRIGVSPQLTLEAAILRQGGFRDNPRRRVGRRTDLCVTQGAQRAGEQKIIDLDGGRPTSTPTARCGKLTDARLPLRRAPDSPTARSSSRCGRAATAPTTTSRA